LVVTRDGHLDALEVLVETRPDAAAAAATVGAELQQRIKALVGVNAQVSVRASGGVERTATGKAKRVVDQRPKN
jgi:phenylacetate-CoA ligase